MANLAKKAAIALAATTMVAAAPASATVFEYTFTNGDVMTIDTDTGTGSWVGANIDTQFTGDFSNFQGGANPSFMTELTTLTGTRNIRGQTVTPTNQNGNRTHPFKLKSRNGGTQFNLWSWWGDPVVSGDYVRTIGEYRVVPPVDVPAPGVLGLFALALVALGFGRRRRNKVEAA